MLLQTVSIDQIDEPSYDVRIWISREDLEELAESINAVGILQPLRLFEKNGRYEIEDGHRRFLAAKMANVSVVPAMIIDSQEGKREFHKLHANLHAERLSPIELSRTLNDLKDRFHYDNEELAKLMGRSVSRVSQILNLINMDPNLVRAMEERFISETAARLLQQIPDPERRVYYISYIKDGGATVDTIRSWVAQEKVWAETPKAAPQLEESNAPRVDITYPTQRCSCCRKQVRMDALHRLPICPDCYDEVNQLIPAIYADMKRLERESGDDSSQNDSI